MINIVRYKQKKTRSTSKKQIEAIHLRKVDFDSIDAVYAAYEHFFCSLCFWDLC
ncbi:hypothetical protein HMPREF1348_02360 [Enterococcus faecium 505]|uniref:Uncharacterized protein n=1 Tax=Enterococcus faecium 505 TaxID=1134806 RepID=J7CTF1_ENTFC|nr:hypothetical protein M395_02450 [Enterococcus faecium T110]EJY43602.1 hypothetical protein HMPREF1348_02360 [Enterococcus faecium 505]GEA72642.1 hypothetical protein ESP02_10120 [Enterococcus sp. NBRC 3427]